MFSSTSDTDLSASEPCQTPLTYRFGEIDSRFDVQKQELFEIMREVEKLWFTALDAPVLRYQEDGKVVIHLVYSKDQQRTEDERRFSQRIETKKSQTEVMEQEYRRLSKQYIKDRDNFKSTLSEYEAKVQAYNNRIRQWDGKSEIPPSEKLRLNEIEQEINQLKTDIERKEQNLESLRKRSNTKSRQLNRLIDQQNTLIAEYNNRFSRTTKFDQGRYIKQESDERINIFQFANRAQLKTVLAHETGHALGLGHVSNPESIMHSMMGEQNIFNLQLSDQDIKALKQRCRN